MVFLDILHQLKFFLVNEANEHRHPFQYICKEEIFNEQGLVIIQWNLTSECELLKTNRSFLEEHHIFHQPYTDRIELRNHMGRQPCN